jgi:hypothetical protein
VTRIAQLLIPLFRHAWGATLGELAAADGQPFALPDDTAVLAPAELREAQQCRAALAEELVQFLWSQNQFVIVDRAGRGELSRSIGSALSSIARGTDLLLALQQHRAELAPWVRAHYGQSPRQVVCAEYSPQLQLAVLGLEHGALTGPVLDVGCGPSAALVRFLRAQGVSAHGVDRAAPADVASRGDWLTFDYGSARWATVLSHLGFTLHFLHHHLAAGTTAYEYARAYMAMLRSLRVGGLLAYTPGVPFIEDLLDASLYRVHRSPFAEPLRVAALRDIEASTGLSLSHATHIERLA